MGKRRVLPIGLLVAAAFLGFADDSGIFNLSRESGVYRSDVRLEFRSNDASLTFQYRFKESKTSSFVRYRVPILLSAVQGEERRYTLVAQALDGNLLREEREFVYLIDKKSPRSPKVSLPEGEYAGEQSLKFVDAEESRIYYSRGLDPDKGFTLWDGIPIALKAGPDGGNVEICAYAEDQAGNRSTASVFRYRLRTEAAEKRERYFSVLSPVPGVFLNPQTLFIAHEGYDWIRFSLDGSDPESGKPYDGPRKIPGAGKMVLKLAAKRAGEGVTDRTEVTFEQSSDNAILLADGVFETDSVADLAKFGAEFSYCVEERTPKAFDAPAVREVRFETTRGAVRTIPLRIKSLNEGTNGEYRFFYVIDGRVPGPVEMAVDGDEPISNGRRLRISAANGSAVRYTLDGREPDSESPLYEGPVALSLPEDTSGNLVVKARAFLGTSKAGPVAEKKIRFSTEKPRVKSVRSGEKRTGGFVFLTADLDPDLRAVYEIAWDGKEPNEPTAGSPETTGIFVLQVPYGYSRDVAVRVAVVDRAGNISVHPDTFRFSLHRVAPEAPQVFIQDDVVHLRSKERCFIRLRETGILQGILDNEDFHAYEAPVALPVPSGKRIEYSVEAYSEDDLGNRSEVAGPFLHVSDRRIPRIPGILPRTEEGKLYKDDCVLDFANRPGDLELFYTFTEDGTEPPVPDGSSLKIKDRIVFRGKDGKEIPYRVKVLSRYADSPEKGEIADFRFTVDRLPPEDPELFGLPQKSVVNHGIELVIKPRKEEERVFYRLWADGGTAKLTGELRAYEEPIRLPAVENETVRYEVAYEVRDPAGNATSNSSPLVFVVDRVRPAKPVFRLLAADQQELELSSDEGRILYEIAGGGKLPPYPGPKSPLYRGALSAGSTAFDVFAVAAVTVDEAGNFSEPLLVSDIAVHPERLLTEVEFDAVRAGNVLVLSWKDQGDDAVFFSEERNGQPRLYERPLLISCTEERGRTLVYQSLRGKPFVFSIPTIIETVMPTVDTTPPEKVATTVVLKNTQKIGVVHYEIGTNGIPPRPVTRFSPLFRDTLEFTAADGETVSYFVELKAFPPSGTEGSKSSSFSFTIDRTAPIPPVVEGAMNEHFYVVDRTISLKSNEGTILYDFREVPSLNPSPETLKPRAFSVYEKPISAVAPEGTMKSFVVHAVTVDSVGNRSISVSSLVFTIDKAVVYLSPSGKDDQEGSRSFPLKSLRKALSVLRNSRRTSLFLAKGNYPCDTTLEAFKDYVVVGSFEESSWRKTGEASIITFAVPGTAPAILAGNRELSLESIVVSGTAGAGDGFIRVETGSLKLTDCAVRLEGRNRVLVQNGGRVLLSKTSISSEDLGQGELILSRGGSLEITGSTLSFARCEQASLIVVKHPAEASIDDSTLTCGEGLVTTGIHSLGAMLKAADVKIHAGQGSLASLGVKCDGGTAFFDRLSLYLAEKAYISTGISAFSGAIDVKKSYLSVAGRYGATGLYLKNGSALVTDTVFEAGTSDDFLYHFHCEGGSAVLSGNAFSGGTSGDFIAAVLQDSSSVWKQNSMTLGKGTVSSSGFMLKGNSPLIAEANRFAFTGQKGVFFVIPRETSTVKIEKNRFTGGGGVIVRAEDPSGGWSRIPALITIRSADALNALKRAEGTFSGNVSE